VLAAVPPAAAATFTPLMTCYLTDNTPPEEVQRAKEVRLVGQAGFAGLGWLGWVGGGFTS